MSNIKDFLLEKVDYTFKGLSTDVEFELVQLFQSNKKIRDKDVHKLADDLNIEHSILEEAIYESLQSFWSEGRAMAKGVDSISPDERELAMGVKVEMEHTTSKVMAYRIALDHLSELPDYYSRLKKMEGE